jgi:maleylacetoacetate isomerase
MAGDSLQLHGYWRSSSSYRVRIALNLKGLRYRHQEVHLLRGGGEQNLPDYRAINPLGLVPALTHGERVIVQSVAICEYLEETFPKPPLLPPDPTGRARIRTIVQTVADEIQPLNNLAVLQYLAEEMRQDEAAVSRWYQRWVARGFDAIERWLDSPAAGACCHGDQPTLADCFLVPQVYNAERFGCDLAAYPRILRIAGHCRRLQAFREAAPENQPDAA